MMKNSYTEILEIYKILSQIRNILSYKIASDKKRENFNQDEDDYLENIVAFLKLLEDASSYFNSEKDDLDRLENWKSQLQQHSKLHNQLNLTLIQNNQKEIISIFNQFKQHIQANDQSKVNTVSDDYTNFINQLRTFKILSTTELFSDITSIEIAYVNNQLDQTRNSYEAVNKIYKDIRGKNENFNYFIDAENNEALKNLYDEIYKTEYELADTYRKYSTIILIAVGLLVFLLILGGIIQNLFYLTDPKNYIPIKYDLGSFIRYLAIFTLTAPAWYFARESSRHRQVAYKAKILGTELNAFPHYVKELEKSERIKMRTNLADKFFGQELYSDKNSTPSSVLEQSKVTVDAMKTVTALVPKQ